MNRRWLTLLVGAALAAPAPAAELRTLAGQKHTGELVSLDAQGATVRTMAGEVKVPAAQILIVDFRPSAPVTTATTLVELIDGSAFYCTAFAIKGKQVELTVAGGLAVKLPMSALASILKDANDAKLVEQWREMNTPPSRRDLVVVKKADRLQKAEGTYGEANAEGEAIAFEDTRGTKRTVPLAGLQGMVFAQRMEGVIPPTVCKVQDAARNSLVAKSVVYRDGTLEVTTLAGVTVSLKESSLAKLDFSKGKLAYLSDLDPARVQETSTEGWVVHFRRDKALYGNQPIVFRVKQPPKPNDSEPRYESKTYEKGLTLHARTVLEYDLAGEYKDFQAVLGVAFVADSAVPESNVKLTIEGDGRELLAATIRRQDDPKPVNLDVRGVRKLRITVASVGLLDTGNQMTLAVAKVSK